MNKELFVKGAEKYGFNITASQLDKFSAYSSLLKEWNEKMNLTAVCDDDGISIRHFLDSISAFSFLEKKPDAKIIDIGTGAGFPGLPLKLMSENLNITLLDSLNKRITFLNEVITKLNLKKIEAIHARAEEYGHNPKFRGQYDFAVSRAVASLKVLSEYAVPFLKLGGCFIALKAFEIEEELEEAKAMIGNLGGKIREIKEIEIPFSDTTRKIVVIEKINPTPKSFPRSNKKIKSK